MGRPWIVSSFPAGVPSSGQSLEISVSFCSRRRRDETSMRMWWSMQNQCSFQIRLMIHEVVVLEKQDFTMYLRRTPVAQSLQAISNGGTRHKSKSQIANEGNNSRQENSQITRTQVHANLLLTSYLLPGYSRVKFPPALSDRMVVLPRASSPQYLDCKVRVPFHLNHAGWNSTFLYAPVGPMVINIVFEQHEQHGTLAKRVAP